MTFTDIEIHTGGVDLPYRRLGDVTAEISKATAFAHSPSIEDVNIKLQEEAAIKGANAVIYVTYERGSSFRAFEFLKATGIAVVVQSDEMPCPVCAEKIKKAAKKCRFCGEVFSPSTME